MESSSFFGFIHRPLFPDTRPEETARKTDSREIDIYHESMWISYCPMPEERNGIVPNVVFPTGIDRRDDLGMPNRFDVYYGMADKRIGVARFDLPDILPPEGVADSPKKKV